MLILILIDVQCSQKVVFSFEKSSFGGILAKITKNCMRIGTTVPLDEGHVNLWEEPIS